MVDIAKLFSPDIFPRFRNYSLIVLGLILGGNYFDVYSGDGQEQIIQIELDGSIVTKDFCYNHWMFDASQPWTKSPAYIEEGQSVAITVQGSYLYKETMEVYSANGYIHNEDANFYMDTLANKGQLLAQIVVDAYHPKMKTKEVLHLKTGLNEFTAESDGYLWFATNQIVFHPYNMNDWKRYLLYSGDSIDVVTFRNTKPEPAFNAYFGSLSIKIVVAKK